MDGPADKEKQLVEHVRDALSQSLASTDGISALRVGPLSVDPPGLLAALGRHYDEAALGAASLAAAALANDVTSNALVNIRVRGPLRVAGQLA